MEQMKHFTLVARTVIIIPSFGHEEESERK
jgi:hypothetical protein